MKLDLETGLPELEEGYRWEVRNDSPDYLTVHVMMEVKQSWLARWLTGTPGWISVDSLDVRDFVDRGAAYESEIRKELRRQGYEEYFEMQGYYYAGMVRKVEQTPENVLKVAAKLYEKRQAELEEFRKRDEARAQMEALAGTYPPKKLVLG